MFSSRINLQKLKELLLASSTRTTLYQEQQQPLIYCYTQICNYVDVTMKWKKDSFYDSIEIVDSSLELKPLLALKNCIANDPRGCIPISDISKSGYELDVPIKVAKFLRRYPSVFEEFVGPQYNLPWFRLTPKAVVLDREERAVYEDSRSDIIMRLKRLILMTKEKKLPFKTIKGVQWYLGLPDEFLKNPEENLDLSFKVVEMGDELQGLSVDTDERMLSLLQKNAAKKGLVVPEETSVPLAFPLYPSKGLRLKRKISHWLEEFQKLPYVSPYEDSSDLNPNTDISEKRVIGVLHELLGLFVDNSAQRKKLICLRTHLGLPQKFHRAFQRHPDMFYLSLRNKTCTVILKEAYNDSSAMETHPLLKVREKYVTLMKKSWSILKARRQKGRSGELNNASLDVEFEGATKVTGERSEGEEDLLQEEAHSDQIVA